MLESNLNNQDTLLVPQKNSRSRYFLTPFIKDDKSIILYNLFSRLDYSDVIDIQYHIVEELEENRLDKIAVKYYNDSSYYWLIAMANNIIDPFIIVKGTTLKIPPTDSYILRGLTTNG
jgi:hypothetical protein